MSLAAVLLLASIAPPPTDDLADAIRTAYQANREALAPHGTIRFEEYYGRLAGGHIDEVGDLRWERILPLEEGLFAYDRGAAVARHTYRIETLLADRRRISGQVSMYHVEPWQALTDGETILYDTIGVMDADTNPYLIHTPDMRTGAERLFQHVALPLSPGALEPSRSSSSDLGSTLESAQGDHPTVELISIVEDERVNDRPVVLLTFHLESGITQQYWVDLERGAIPLRIRSMPPAPAKTWTEYVCSDVRWVGNRAWYPMRSSVFCLDEITAGGRYASGDVREKVVTEIDLVSPPDRALFRIELPEARPIVNSTTWSVYPEAKDWDLEAIGPLAAARARPLNPRASETPAISGSRAATRLPAAAFWIAGLLLVVVGGLLLRRRHHAAA